MRLFIAICIVLVFVIGAGAIAQIFHLGHGGEVAFGMLAGACGMMIAFWFYGRRRSNNID